MRCIEVRCPSSDPPTSSLGSRYKTVLVLKKGCSSLFNSSVFSLAFSFLCPHPTSVGSSSCMAANLQRRGFAFLGKWFVDRSWIGGSKGPAPLSAYRRGCVVHSHFSAYDKDPDEAVQPAVVPDDVIQPHESSDKYWAPHPDTGVFGPSEQNRAGPAESRRPPPAAANSSVLEEKAWFRPLEDVDKPRPS